MCWKGWGVMKNAVAVKGVVKRPQMDPARKVTRNIQCVFT